MIESLRKTETKLLALGAVTTFGIGFFLGLMVRISHASLDSGAKLTAAWGREALAGSAAAGAWRLAEINVVLQLMSVFVISLAAVGPEGLSRVFARALYVASFIAVMATVGVTMLFIVCHS